MRAIICITDCKKNSVDVEITLSESQYGSGWQSDYVPIKKWTTGNLRYRAVNGGRLCLEEVGEDTGILGFGGLGVDLYYFLPAAVLYKGSSGNFGYANVVAGADLEKGRVSWKVANIIKDVSGPGNYWD